MDAHPIVWVILRGTSEAMASLLKNKFLKIYISVAE